MNYRISTSNYLQLINAKHYVCFQTICPQFLMPMPASAILLPRHRDCVRNPALDPNLPHLEAATEAGLATSSTVLGCRATLSTLAFCNRRLDRESATYHHPHWEQQFPEDEPWHVYLPPLFDPQVPSGEV